MSGATAGNWVAKTANLLVDGYGGPARVGVLLPPHWQGVCLLLAGVATGATVVVAEDPAGLSGCDLAFVHAPLAADAASAGVGDVLALSGHPFGLPVGDLPAGVEDYAREVPSYGDGWSGPPPPPPSLVVEGSPLGALPELDLGPADRALLATGLASRTDVARLLACLRAGAAVVLATGGADLARAAEQERATAVAGADVPGLRHLP